MEPWLDALLAQSQPAVLVTVARAEGSAPREAGARMLVTAGGQAGTIGGGHLEWSALGFARDMLMRLARPDAERQAPRLERFALGPTLGQCCGGVVWLVFEPVQGADHGYYRELAHCMEAGRDCWRVLRSAGARALLDDQGRAIAGAAGAAPAPYCCLQHDEAGWTLVDPVRSRRPQLYLFGAGHVGAALVRALAPLPCAITWVDEREELFPAGLPANVRVEATDAPEALIDAAPPHASFLVMTHSHALDQQLAERILRRPAGGWFGLIGSRTKRIQFERRLAARGVAAERIAGMVCPIGLPGIQGKQPAVIAASVAAQLLQVWEAQAALASPADVPMRERA